MVNLEQAIGALADARHVLVACDYDGTLAELVSHPDLATPHPDSVKALTDLALLPNVSVLVVSGRRLDDLRRFVGEIPGLALLGEHGSDDGSTVDSRIDELSAPVLAELERIASTVPASWVEVKRYAGAFHHRNSDPELAAAAVERIREWSQDRDEVIVTEGKRVIEVSVTDRHKGHAVELARRQVDADAVVFIGDDVSDEEVFATLGKGDVGVKVGPGDTKAGYRVTDVEGVTKLLSRLLLTLSGGV